MFSCLRELNLEGNQLGALPMGALSLNLKYLRITNNFMHPLLWRETTNNQPQVTFEPTTQNAKIFIHSITEKKDLIASTRQTLPN